MLKSYLKIAFRSLWRSKAHSLINIVGLSLGIACCILIVLFVKDELTFDRFHSRAADIYRVYGIEDWGENQRFFNTNTPFPMGPALKDNLQEVEHMVRITNIGPQIQVGKDLYTETVMVAGQDFLTMFDFELIKGDRASALMQQANLLITEETAKRFFGEEDPIDKRVAIQLGEQLEDFVVKGVFKNPPTNSSIQFSMMISDLNFPRLYNERVLTSAWFNILPETYVMLTPGTDAAKLQEKFPSIFRPLVAEEDFTKSKFFVGLQPMTEIHLDTTFPPAIAPVSDPKYSFILSGIALLILFVACINFVTLSIGRSMKRAKEVGIRKVVGAVRRQLIFQFVGEAIIITVIALIAGLVLAILNLPLFNDLSGKRLVMMPDGFMFLVFSSLITIIGLFAGSYPAFILSGFKPVSILKGAVATGSNRHGLRKVLVGVQLVLSIFLISSTLLMNQQLNYLQEKNLGFDREQLAVVQLNVQGGRLRDRIPKGFEIAEQFKVELAKIPQIAAVCGSSHDFGQGNWVSLGYTDDNGTYRTFFYNTIDEHYIPTLKMELVQGRNFTTENTSDKRRGIIVNEAFAASYGWTDAIGRKLPGKNFQDHEVIGVVKDFHYASLYTKVEPLILAMDPMIAFSGAENINVGNSPIPKLIMRLHPGNAAETLKAIEGVWDKITGGEEFAFSFVDQSLDAQYRTDQNLGKIVSIATMLAIVIGSLGLYGLASLAMQNRTKEISIRKVLGATERSLLILLSREYIYLIFISLLVSIPITWYLMNDWLSSFQYRVEIGAGIFIFAGGISLAIAVITISYQAIKTAWSQPADTLKYE